MKELRFTVHKEVSYWNNQKGEGVLRDGTDNTDRWGIDMSYANETIALQEEQGLVKAFNEAVAEYIEHTLFLPYESFGLIQDEEGRISGNVIENADSAVLETIKEQDREEGNGNQLYIADYDIRVEMIESSVPSFEELARYTDLSA